MFPSPRWKGESGFSLPPFQPYKEITYSSASEVAWEQIPSRQTGSEPSAVLKDEAVPERPQLSGVPAPSLPETSVPDSPSLFDSPDSCLLDSSPHAALALPLSQLLRLALD